MSPRRGISFVVSGPSGVGKTSLVKRAVAADPELAFSVSHTTRRPRPGERDGVDYWFVDAEAFQALRADDAFLEWAEYQGNFYGTSRRAVDEPTGKGQDLVLEVEIQGARQLKDRLPEAVFVFVLPPSLEQLERRLRGRGSDAEDAVRRRLARAQQELRESAWYDYWIVNDELERALADLGHIVGACRLERERVRPQLADRFELE